MKDVKRITDVFPANSNIITSHRIHYIEIIPGLWYSVYFGYSLANSPLKNYTMANITASIKINGYFSSSVHVINC
jgi:hypothetical protein